jgi:MFS family permease
MVKGFQGGDDANASFYTGLLVSAFTVAEACTTMTWGTVSDYYGRKPVILMGLAGTALSSLIFGFSTSFWVALGA